MQSEDSPQRRPAKRRRRSSGSQSSERPPIGYSGAYPISAPPQMTQMALGVNSPLTNEIKLLMENRPTLISQAMRLVVVYQRLWEAYMREYTRAKGAEKEWHLLADSNGWLEKSNESLHRLCNDREAILCDSRQSFQSVRQGILDIFQNTYGFHQLLPLSGTPVAH